MMWMTYENILKKESYKKAVYWKSTMAGKRQWRATPWELRFKDCFLQEGNNSQLLSSFTLVFLAGVLEYLTSNILELATKEIDESIKKCITPEHVCQVIENNKELLQLFKEDRSCYLNMFLNSAPINTRALAWEHHVNRARTSSLSHRDAHALGTLFSIFVSLNHKRQTHLVPIIRSHKCTGEKDFNFLVFFNPTSE